MKLRTVLNELRCAPLCVGREELLDEDVIVVPKYEKNVPPEAKLLRLCSLKSYLEEHVKADEGQVLLVHTQGELPGGFSCTPDAVVVSHPYSYGDFRATFLDLPASAAILEVRREKMFEAFLASYDLAQFARRSSEVLGNPVIITNADMRLLATAGDFPADAPDVQEVLSCGYVSESVNSDLETDGMIEAVRRARHSLLSGALRFGRHWVTSIIYYHHLEMGRYDVMESDRSITGFDLELVDYASQLAGIMIDRLGAAGERVGFGSSVLEDLVAGGFANEPTMRAQLALTGLPLDVSYALMAVMGQRGAGKDYYARVGGIVARAFRDCLWCAHEDCLVVLAPIGKNECVGYDDYARAARRLSGNTQLTSALDNNDLRAFVAEPLRDLTLAPGRLAQATDLASACASRVAGRVVYFWENRFAVLACAPERSDRLERMLDKRVVAMADYDREHGTDYLKTTVMSVRFPGSPAEAASALSVHRNTYFYRVNKVRELFFIDLKDGDDRLATSFSTSILEGLGS